MLRAIICWLFHTGTTIARRKLYGDERLETGRMFENEIRCSCGRKYLRYAD